MEKDTLQNIVGALLGVLWVILCAISAIVWHDVQAVKTEQQIHNSGAEVRAKNIDEKIVDIKANNLKQWDVIDKNAENETDQEVQIGVNKNDIEHLKTN